MVAAFAATSLAGCSGGDSKEDFVAAADEVCREADADIKEIGAPRVEEGIFDYVRQAQEVAEELVADLRELDPPKEGREQVEQMIDGLERSTALLEPLAQATLDRDTERLEDLQEEVTQITDEVSEIAEEYGFEVCGAKVLDPVR